MRGEPLHGNVERSHFRGEAWTAPNYRLLSIRDVYPAMIWVEDAVGVSIAGELYDLDLESLEEVLTGEPPGLGLGVVHLSDGQRSLGIVWVCPSLPSDAIDISEFGGWRAYPASRVVTSGEADEA
jgi:allophanate hydrolase